MKLGNFKGLLVLLILAIIGTSLNAQALAKVKAAGVLKVGTEGLYAPFTFHDATGALTGFDVELATEVAKRIGVKAQFVEGPWDGLIAGLDVNRQDIVANEVAITDERKKKYDFSTPYLASKAVIIVRSDNTTIKDFNDLKGKKSVQSASSNFTTIAKENGAQIVVGTGGFENGIALILSGRVDATINDRLSFLDYVKRQPNAKLKVAATKDIGQPSAFILSKNRDDLRDAINKALADMQADGTYLAISKKYFGEDVSK